MKRKSIRGIIYSTRLTTIVIACWFFAQLLTVGLSIAVLKFIPRTQSLSRFLFIIIICGFSLVVGSVVSFALTNRASEITRKINICINKVAEGDYSVRLENRDDGEFGEVIDNFNKMVKRLSSVAYLQKDFTTTFSHEFKTPIVSIKGYAELLNEADNLTQEQKEYLAIIIDESKILASLAERTMLLSKLDNEDSLSVKAEEFFLDEQLSRRALLFDEQMTEKNIDFEYDVQRVKITGYKDLLNEVWTNLIGNAVKYTRKNGKVKVTLKKKNGAAVVTVEDTGIGMSEETLSKMYESFYRAENVKKIKGLGLGLAISKKIIDLSGGTITCASTVGKGSYFTVTLPLTCAKKQPKNK